MNAWVAVCLGLAFWMVLCTVKGNYVRRSIVFTRFIVFLAMLGLAAYWWTP